MLKLALILTGVCYAIISKNDFHVYLIINASLLMIMLMNRRNINVVHLCALMLAVYLGEMLLFKHFIVTRSDSLSAMQVNAIIFSVHFLTDLLLFFLVVFRAPLTRSRLAARNKPYGHIFTYNAEFALTGLFMVFMAVDLLALGENFIRHLDEFGFSPETAQLLSGWNWVYYQYENIKSVLLGLTFLLVWMMTYPIGQDAYQQAPAG
ncbi:hypothetical protein SG34_007205 [Thalassomonas viridans]|uniref:Uncharacterized protein n=1 Tax=Thalassomonas viridans TaxID=137584 RepID=A0AAE9Z5X1_9GAMM|nr:hypothetical protein [Thalassomonas viridans]WDE06684.1 hypothetical protein SG34_007205 [Thalassomonas viridans]